MHVLLAVFTLFTYILLPSSVSTENVQAIAADAFVESIGVNTHWTFTNVYTLNYTGLKAKLAEAGIRYVRDGCSSAVRMRVNDLYSNLGIRINMIPEIRNAGPGAQPLNLTAIPEALKEIKSEVLNAVVSFESPNEYDCSHGSDTDWIDNIKNYTIIMNTIVKSDEIMRHIPIIGPSLTTLEAYEAVGAMDPYIDYANLHLYQWGYWPGNEGWDGKGAIPSVTYYLDKYAHLQSPSNKPVQVTETGYQDNLQHSGLSEIADGKYAARAFAEFFRRGISRTFKYELIDQGIPGPEGAFGLLRNDLSEKPSFRAVKNIINVLADPGATFQPGTFDCMLNGSIDNVRQILFQKQNGDFYFMFWTEVNCWNFTTQVDLYPPAQPVVLTFQNKVSQAILYTLNNTGDMSTFNVPIDNQQIHLNATDTLSIVQLRTSNNI